MKIPKETKAYAIASYYGIKTLGAYKRFITPLSPCAKLLYGYHQGYRVSVLLKELKEL